ncbi:MAG TPA: helix-turn-helix domain-containing protein [Methylomirabilota bacterium]|nr:helix-turn-helix domain-containing protein [Methylomirabilota bacterium]
MVFSDEVILAEHLPPSLRSRAAAPAGAALPLAAAGGSLDETLADWERRMILDALAKASGIQARAARPLGISERSLWYRVKKLKIPVRGAEDEIEPA